MSKDNIKKNEDMFGTDIPLIDPDGQIKTTNSTEVKGFNQINTYFKENPIFALSMLFIFIILMTVLVFIVKNYLKKRNPMLEYTKQQTRKLKKDQAYVSSSNKLETPDNISDCIRAFIERTK